MKKINKKIEYWQNQLLDLGKRNKMINYKETIRATLKIIEPSFEELFTSLVEEENELIFQYPVDKNTDIRTYSIIQLFNELSCNIPVYLGDIKTSMQFNERQKTLKNLRQKSKLALEEQGTNILYLSFGFLEWKDTRKSNIGWVKSPLLLVPVSLILDSLNSPFKLTRYDDDIVVNPTLQHLFEAEYGITIPTFDSENNDIIKFISEVEALVNEKGWKVSKETNLGLLSFLKINMYKDLQNNLGNIIANPVIKAMIGENSDLLDIPEEFIDFNHDAVHPKESFQVISADSSQQDAILFSQKGISFVIQGPPGTGKSQTISNIIAQALAENKKVLFVSEKMAALQVVYNRLSDLGLGEFCLALHSHKANKKEILDDIQNTLDIRKERVKEEALEELDRLNNDRYLLNKYVEELHDVIEPMGISCYEAFGILDEYQTATDVAFNIDGIKSITREQMNAITYNLEVYSDVVQADNFHYINNPWEGFASSQITYDFNQNFKDKTEQLIKQLTSILMELNVFINKYDAMKLERLSDIGDFVNILQALKELPIVPQDLFSPQNIDALILKTIKNKEDFLKTFTEKDRLSEIFDSTIWDIDIAGLLSRCKNSVDNAKRCNISDVSTDELLIVNSNLLENKFSSYCSELSEIIIAIEETLDTFGIIMPKNVETLKVLSSLLNIVIDNNIDALPQWLDINIANQAFNELSEVKDLVGTVHKQKNEIFDEWEEGILEVDYNAILNKYKTDYKSIFKIFNREYKKDKRQISLLNRNPLEKVNDDRIIKALLKVQDLQKEIHNLNDTQPRIEKLYGQYYDGINTNWEKLQNNLKHIMLVNSISSDFIVSQKGKAILTNEVTLDKGNLREILNKINETKIQDLLSKIDKEYIDLNCLETGFLEILEKLKTTFNNISALHTQKNEICSYTKGGILSLDIFENISSAANNQICERELLSQNEKFSMLYGEYYCAEKTNWDIILEIYTGLKKICDIVQDNFASEFLKKISISQTFRKEFNQDVDQIKYLTDDVKDNFEWFNRLFVKDFRIINIDEIIKKCQSCIENIDGLQLWIDYSESKQKCIDNGLNEFISKIESNIPNDIVGAFKKGCYKLWIDAAQEQKKAVANFKGKIQDKRVQSFGEMDEHQLKIARMRVREKLTQNLPNKDRVLHSQDEMSVLQRELAKKKRIMPIRKLFRTIPNLLLKIKPCFMMSPLSVSYFLEAETYNFDMVIFDEASQIFPEDAIGAIFRGKQVIIAGDTNQLPPTNFFTSNANNFEEQYDSDNEDDYNEEIFDSILEETASVLPNRMLLWHYRSKHEHLIAFSNNHIYKNSLITFPSSMQVCNGMGVEYYKVIDGIYEDRCNILEAKKCVEIVKDHIDNYPNRSLGIIAFSEKQQSTIEMELDTFRTNNPMYEWFFNENKEEPFFVKNLENVQGDERDTIIFSICYAKNKSGTMLMFFGPLGKQGGERRLNVAITRAKLNIKLVGSIDPSDIDLSRAKSDGARMLREYIEFAIKGEEQLSKNEKHTLEAEEDKLCNTIYELLISNGYKAQKNVGCSDYKIDIAVEHPGIDGAFVVGVECDGYSYSRTRTARERDNLRSRVLKNMGWNLYRVWSPEWTKNQNAAKQALFEFIEICINNYNKEVEANDLERSYTVPIEADLNQEERDNHYGNRYNFKVYKPADWRSATITNPNDYSKCLHQRIAHVILNEQPVHIDLLITRVDDLFRSRGYTKYYTRKDAIRREIMYSLHSNMKYEDDFIFINDHKKIEVRINDPENGFARQIDYFYVAEIAKAMMIIAKSTVGITKKDLIVETARTLGFDRTGSKITKAMENAIKWLIEKSKIKIVEDKIQVLGEF